MQRHYKKQVSGFDQWDQKPHSEDYLIYPDNIGVHLSLDEVSLSKGELYTYLTNKNGRGKKGTLVACIKGVKSNDLIKVIEKIPLEKRKLVKEVTLDMANNLNLTAKHCFPNAKRVTEALQHVREQHRWKAIEDEKIKPLKRPKKRAKNTILYCCLMEIQKRNY